VSELAERGTYVVHAAADRGRHRRNLLLFP
jgi:hypothetical protein